MAFQRLALILGDQLFPQHDALAIDKQTLIFMAEDHGLCTHFRYHKQKLVFYLSAMRQHAEDLRQGHHLHYCALSPEGQDPSFEEKLSACLKEHSEIKQLLSYQVDDQFMAERLRRFCQENGLEWQQLPSPKFLRPPEDFKSYLEEHKKPFMQVYYKRQRRALNLLLDDHQEPLGGKWSFDEENRQKLPKQIEIPQQPQAQLNATDKEVMALVEARFGQHPGSLQHFNWSTSRRSALAKLNDFCAQRLAKFGPYEDAIDSQETFLFHSVLSPYLNNGLITPDEVLDKALEAWQENDIPFSSIEGLVRQIIGWREFLKGIYNHYELNKNYFGHQRKLKAHWYEGTTGIPPLDDAIHKAQKHGYTHHIERLMVVGNIMLMTGIDPEEVYRWFMEMYVDSADWVMAPNVFGMSQFADGGIFATKPYISGSNYLRKMSHYDKGDWCTIMDGLYWGFIDRHQATFKKNHRMGMMIATLGRMDQDKKDRIFQAAQSWIDKVSYA